MIQKQQLGEKYSIGVVIPSSGSVLFLATQTVVQLRHHHPTARVFFLGSRGASQVFGVSDWLRDSRFYIISLLCFF